MRKFATLIVFGSAIAAVSSSAQAGFWDWLAGNLGECETVSTADSVIFPNEAGDAVILLTQDICW